MRSPGQPERDPPPKAIEFVPKQDLDRAQRENEQLRKQIERLRQEIERLRKELEAALRASKRQAAPHSRGGLKGCPKRPGRKPGRDYGRQACRPLPSRVDEPITVPLPERCPDCGGQVSYESTEAQFQEEIVRRTVVRRFDIAVGCCQDCHRRVQGRHRPQTSDAVGVGAVQLGRRPWRWPHPEQAHGAVVGTYTTGVGPWLWVASEPRWAVSGAGADGTSSRGGDLPRADRSGPTSAGEHPGRDGPESGRAAAVAAGGSQRLGDRVCNSRLRA